MSLNGYIYTKDRQNDTEAGIKIYWRCENRECKGRAQTLNDAYLQGSERAHDMHAPSKQEAEVQKAMARLKDAAASSQEAPSKLVRYKKVNKVTFYRAQYFRRIRPDSTKIRRKVVFDQTLYSTRRYRDQMSYSTKRRIDEMSFDEMSWKQVDHITSAPHS